MFSDINKKIFVLPLNYYSLRHSFISTYSPSSNQNLKIGTNIIIEILIKINTSFFILQRIDHNFIFLVVRIIIRTGYHIYYHVTTHFHYLGVTKQRKTHQNINKGCQVMIIDKGIRLFISCLESLTSYFETI